MLPHGTRKTGFVLCPFPPWVCTAHPTGLDVFSCGPGRVQVTLVVTRNVTALGLIMIVHTAKPPSPKAEPLTIPPDHSRRH